MILRVLFRFFSSIRLTVVLLVLGILLVFFGTLDQVNFGVYHTQQRYFESFLAVWQYPEVWHWGSKLKWLAVPMPGGYVVGPLLIINLLCAHFRYFRPRWSKTGVVLIHLGVVMLLVGQLATQIGQKEYFMWLDEGGTGNYIESFHHDELVVADVTDPQHRHEVVIPAAAFSRDAEMGKSHSFRPEDLPFRIDVLAWIQNAAIMRRADVKQDVPKMPFDKGIGASRDFVVFRMKPTYKQNERNVGTAIVRIVGDDGPVGTWLASDMFRNRQGNGSMLQLFTPQTFEYAGHTYEIEVRYARKYLPARMELLDFKHDIYPGTEIPRNFSSKVRIVNERTGEDRTVLIYMNHPLRFAGYTFYQASFAQGDHSSMFQVVHNPAHWFPYVSCSVIALGMVIQFGLGLLKFAGGSRRKSAPAPRPAAVVEGGVR